MSLLYPSEYPSYWYHQANRTQKPVIVKTKEQVEFLGEAWGPFPWKDPLEGFEEDQEPSILPMVRPGSPLPGERMQQAVDRVLPSGQPVTPDPAANLGQVLPPPPTPGAAPNPATLPRPMALPNPTLAPKTGKATGENK